MKKNKTDWLVVILIVLLIFVIAIIVFRSKNFGSKFRDKVAAFQKQMEDLQAAIQRQIDSLILSEEMEKLMERKVNTYLWMVKVMVAIVLLALFLGLHYYGFDWLTALSGTVGILGAMSFLVPFFVASRVYDINEFINTLTIKIRKFVYRKYGFSPVAIQKKKEDIAHMKKQVIDLKKEMDDLK